MGTPRDSLYGDAPPEIGSIFRVQVHRRVGIEVSENIGKSVIYVFRRYFLTPNHFHLIGLKRYSSAMRKSLIYTVIRYVGRIFFSMESLRKEARPFLAKVVYKRVGELGVGRFTRLYSQK